MRKIIVDSDTNMREVGSDCHIPYARAGLRGSPASRDIRQYFLRRILCGEESFNVISVMVAVAAFLVSDIWARELQKRKLSLLIQNGRTRQGQRPPQFAPAASFVPRTILLLRR